MMDIAARGNGNNRHSEGSGMSGIHCSTNLKSGDSSCRDRHCLRLVLALELGLAPNSPATRLPFPPVSNARWTTVRYPRFLPSPITVDARQPCSPKGAQHVDPKLIILHGARRGSMFVDSICSPPPFNPRLQFLNRRHKSAVRYQSTAA